MGVGGTERDTRNLPVPWRRLRPRGRRRPRLAGCTHAPEPLGGLTGRVVRRLREPRLKSPRVASCRPAVYPGRARSCGTMSSQHGAFGRGRGVGSNAAWHTPSALSQHADAVRELAPSELSRNQLFTLLHARRACAKAAVSMNRTQHASSRALPAFTPYIPTRSSVLSHVAPFRLDRVRCLYASASQRCWPTLTAPQGPAVR